MNQRGFTLMEILVALAIGSVLMLGAARTLPLLQQQNVRMLLQVQLNEELQQMLHTLEKSLRRAGYCHGQCGGEGLKIAGSGESCILLRWDENSNGKWEGVGREDSDFYGYRLRAGNLEMQRGVADCNGPGWESLNDPRVIRISEFRVSRKERQIRVRLSGFATGAPGITFSRERWLMADNL